MNHKDRRQKTENRKQKEKVPHRFFVFCIKPRAVRSVFCFLFSVFCLLDASAQSRPMTVAESVALALQQSPQARAAKFARDAAQVEADRGKPVARPTVTVSAATTAQEPRVTFPYPNYAPATVLPESASRLELSIEQILYRPGLGAARQRYAAQSGAVEQDYRKEIADIALAVKKAYLDVLRAEAGLAAARDGRDAAQKFAAFVQKQIDAGLAKPIDAQTAAGQAAEAQTGVTQAEGGLLLARMNFNRLLGRSLTAEVLLETAAVPVIVPESPDAAVAFALLHRPELLALERNRQAANAGIALARTQSQPTLSLRGQAIEQTQTAFQPQNYVAATLEIRWPILDGGKTRADTQEAKLQALRLQALLDDAKQGVALDVIQAWQKMREAQARIAQTHIQLDAAIAAERVAQTAYEVGRGTAIEMQAAQREVRTARDKHLQAQYDLQAANAEFEHAQGIAPPDLPSSSHFQQTSTVPNLNASPSLQPLPRFQQARTALSLDSPPALRGTSESGKGVGGSGK